MAAPTLSRACRIRNPAIFICDIQERFRPAIFEFNKMVSTATKLLKSAGPLNVPVYVTTQNREKLGGTVADLQPYLTASHANVRADIDKTLFSMVTPEIEELLPKPREGRGETPLDAIIVGIETHICVTQTTLDLLERGHRVYVIVDGVSSINPEERAIALARLRDAGAIITSSESVIFEMLGDAKSSGFKEVSGLVKETKEETKRALGAFAKM